MSVFIDTVRALSDRYPEAIGLWVFFGLLPIATCAFWTLRYRHQLPRLWPAFHYAAASVLGYPTMLVALLILPVSVFSIFVAPALLDAYPTWRPWALRLQKNFPGGAQCCHRRKIDLSERPRIDDLIAGIGSRTP